MAEQKMTKEEEKKILTELAYAQDELNQLKKEHGLAEEEKGLKKLITKLFELREKRQPVCVSKKTYLLLAVFLGSFGAHRFYTKQYVTAVLYLLLCWTGVALAMTLIDLMIVIPIPKDENGNIVI